MRLLLDTHTVLWFLEGSPKLSANAKQAIEDVANEAFLSVASLWEITIKVSLGKLVLSASINDLANTELSRAGIKLLDITVDHLTTLSQLPFHHRDPFDRMIISQAMAESLAVVGVDPAFDHYPIHRVW